MQALNRGPTAIDNSRDAAALIRADLIEPVSNHCYQLTPVGCAWLTRDKHPHLKEQF